MGPRVPLHWGALLAAVALAASAAPAQAGVFGDLGFVQTQNVYYTGLASLSNFTYVPPPAPPATPTRRAALAVGTGAADNSIYGLRQRQRSANAFSIGVKKGAGTVDVPTQGIQNFTVGRAGNLSILSFAGLDAWTSKSAGQGVYRNSNEYHPKPSPGGCAGNGYVIQIVNRAIALYSTVGLSVNNPRRLSPIVPLNQFFGVTPYLTKGSPDVGDSLLEGTCVYDQKRHSFYMTFQWLSVGTASPWDKYTATRDTFGSGVVLAVSNGSDPRLPWMVYFIPTINDGKKNNLNDNAAPLSAPGGPFYMDYLIVTLDAFGVFITATEYNIQGNLVAYNIYALGKTLVRNGKDMYAQRVVVPAADVGSSWNNLAPIRYPGDAEIPYTQFRNGTTYFTCTTQNSTIVTLALTYTWTLNTDTPALMGYKQEVAVPSSQPVNPTGVLQRGPFKSQTLALGSTLGRPQPRINTNADGAILSSCSAAVQHGYGGGRRKGQTGTYWITWNVGQADWAGIAVAQIDHQFRNGTDGVDFLDAKVVSYRVVSVDRQSLVYPSIGFNKNGKGVVVASVMGTLFWPTAVFLRISDRGVLDKQLLMTAGGGFPLDNNDAYTKTNGLTEFGDMHSVYIADDGTAFCFVEYVSGGHQYTSDALTPMDQLGQWANWATAVFQVDLNRKP